MSAYGAKETFHARADNVIGKLDLAVPEEPFHLWQFKHLAWLTWKTGPNKFQ